MVYKLVIDADSLLYTACYRHQQTIDGELLCKLEHAYMDFVSAIDRMRSMVWAKYELDRKEDTIEFEIVFSPKKTFRNKLSEAYKANRKPATIVGIGELKQMVFDRLDATQSDIVEADDIVISRAIEEDNVTVGCIDKDIYTHSPVACIDYKKWEWTEPVDEDDIETEYYCQAIMGDSTDGIKGVEGIGKVGANALCYNPLEPMTYEKYVSLFESEEDAILSMRLVRMDQFKKGRLELWRP